jgi:hypothetical protein
MERRRNPPQEALPWGPLEQELRRTDPTHWLQLGPEAGLNALNHRRILIGRFASAPELQQALAHAPAPLTEWRQEADRYVPGLPERVSPCRRLSLEGPDLRFDLHTGGAPGERPLVVGLTGDWGMLMGPVPYVAEALQRHGHDLLLVRRRWRGGYFRGGQGDWLDQIGPAITALSGRRRRPRAVFGTSAGGLPALVLAEQLGAARGLAIGPCGDAALFARGGPIRRLRRWPRWRHWRPGGGPSLLVLHPADHPGDREAASLIDQRYRALRLAPARLERRAEEGCTDHNLVQFHVQAGRPLPDLLAAWLALT